jgi:hypothetical protein
MLDVIVILDSSAADTTAVQDEEDMATAPGPTLRATAALASAVFDLAPRAALMPAGCFPPPMGCCPLSAPSQLRHADVLSAASLSSDEDDDEELALRTPLAAVPSPDSGAVHVSNFVGSPPAGGGIVVERRGPLAALSVDGNVEGNVVKSCAAVGVVGDDEG